MFAELCSGGYKIYKTVWGGGGAEFKCLFFLPNRYKKENFEHFLFSFLAEQHVGEEVVFWTTVRLGPWSQFSSGHCKNFSLLLHDHIWCAYRCVSSSMQCQTMALFSMITAVFRTLPDHGLIHSCFLDTVRLGPSPPWSQMYSGLCQTMAYRLQLPFGHWQTRALSSMITDLYNSFFWTLSEFWPFCPWSQLYSVLSHTRAFWSMTTDVL